MIYNPFSIDGKILLKARDDYMLYDYSGNLVNSFKGVIYTPYICVNNEKIIVFNKEDNKYYVYSPTGELLKTYRERPLELGIIKNDRTKNGKYKSTIKYPILKKNANIPKIALKIVKGDSFSIIKQKNRPSIADIKINR